MHQSNSWLDANKLRSYPLRKSTLDFDILLDASFLISGKRLPLKVSAIKVTDKFISYTILDSDNTFVGMFYYTGQSVVKMSATAKGCSGTAIFSGKLLSELNNYNNLSDEFELRTVKYFPKFSVDSINGLSGNVDLVENNFLRFNTDILNQLTISSRLAFAPKCQFRVPIQSINGVVPNAEGEIALNSVNEGLTVGALDGRVKVSSAYSLEDFRPNAISGPRGDLGIPGPTGAEGLDGQVTCTECDSPTVTRFPALFHDGTRSFGMYSIFTNFKELTKVATFNKNILAVINNNFCYFSTGHINNFPLPHEWNLLNLTTTETLLNIVYVGNNFIISGTNKLLKRYDVFGNFIETLSPPIDAKYMSSSDSNTFIISDGSEVYKYNGSSFIRQLISSSGIINNVRYVDDAIYVVYDTGRIDINTGSLKTVVVEDGTPIYDVFGEWVVGKNGLLYRVNEDLSVTNFSMVSSTLRSIDGFGPDYVIAVGDDGTTIKYDGSIWNTFKSSSVKNWKSVSIATESDTYIVGVDA